MLMLKGTIAQSAPAANKDKLPELSTLQLKKIRHLTMVSMATKNKVMYNRSAYFLRYISILLCRQLYLFTTKPMSSMCRNWPVCCAVCQNLQGLLSSYATSVCRARHSYEIWGFSHQLVESSCCHSTSYIYPLFAVFIVCRAAEGTRHEECSRAGGKSNTDAMGVGHYASICFMTCYCYNTWPPDYGLLRWPTSFL